MQLQEICSSVLSSLQSISGFSLALILFSWFLAVAAFVSVANAPKEQQPEKSWRSTSDTSVSPGLRGWPWGTLIYMAALNNIPRMIAYSGDTSHIVSAVFTAIPLSIGCAILSGSILRKLKLPRGLAALGMVPFVNIILWLVLGSFRKSAAHEGNRSQPDCNGRSHALISGLATGAIVAIGACTLTIGYFHSYGIGLFILVPFLVGFISTVTYAKRERRTLKECQGLAALSIVLAGVMMITCGIEGICCVLIALPLGLVLGTIGATLGFWVQPSKRRDFDSKGMLFCLPIMVPGIIAIDCVTQPQPPLFKVTTSIIVNAPPYAVRKAILSDCTLDKDPLLSVLGVNQLRQWSWRKNSDSITRVCRYEMGAETEEPVTQCNLDRIEFTVDRTPEAMRETSPYQNLKPLHIQDHYVVQSGEFLITPSRHGTQLTATTEYQHNIWPVEYWALWSDQIMHRIHLDVLNKIKCEAEGSI